MSLSIPNEFQPSAPAQALDNACNIKFISRELVDNPTSPPEPRPLDPTLALHAAFLHLSPQQ